MKKVFKIGKAECEFEVNAPKEISLRLTSFMVFSTVATIIYKWFTFDNANADALTLITYRQSLFYLSTVMLLSIFANKLFTHFEIYDYIFRYKKKVKK